MGKWTDDGGHYSHRYASGGRQRAHVLRDETWALLPATAPADPADPADPAAADLAPVRPACLPRDLAQARLTSRALAVDGGDDFTPRSSARLAAANREKGLSGAALRETLVCRPKAGAPRIGLSGVPPSQAELLRAVAVGLGGVIVEGEAALGGATHLVLGVARRAGPPPGAPSAGVAAARPKRTLKVLHAVQCGAWLLRTSWLLDSVDAGGFVAEEGYELAVDFPGGQRARLAREAGAPLRPLRGLSVAVCAADAATAEQLRRLASGAGATLTAASRAAVCIGGAGGAKGRARERVVEVEWLYDSVASGQAADPAEYRVE